MQVSEDCLGCILWNVVQAERPEEWDEWTFIERTYHCKTNNIGPGFTLPINRPKAFEMAGVCKAFWKALQKIPEVKKSLFALKCKIGLFGTTFDGDMYPYFLVRFYSEPYQYLKELVDSYPIVLGNDEPMPFEKTLEVEGRYITVSLTHTGEADGYLLWYNYDDPKSLDGLDSVIKDILHQKKWTTLKNSLLVSSNVSTRSSNQISPDEAQKKADSLNISHMIVEFHNSRTMIQLNVEECVKDVVRQILQSDDVHKLQTHGQSEIHKFGGKKSNKCSLQ